MVDFDWQQDLKNKYPLTLSRLYYFECDKGWSEILDRLCATIEDRIQENKLEEMYASQVKEKFGTLRFYMSGYDDFIEGAIALTEKQSCHVCEVCGTAGRTEKIRGWLKTLCNDHFNHYYSLTK